MTKNDGFEQKQKDENYSIIEKTRNLILDLRKRKKGQKVKLAAKGKKEQQKGCTLCQPDI